MNVLVVGGCGFIGSNVVESLTDKGLNVFVADRNESSQGHSLVVNVLNIEELQSIFNRIKFDVVIHLVGSNTSNISNKEFSNHFNLNIVSIRNIVSCCKKFNSKLIFISSAAVYGSAKLPHSEDSELFPVNIYGVLKYLAEQIVLNNLNKGTFTILRLFNIYSLQDDNKIIAKLIKSINSGETLNLVNINQKRDFVDIKDIIYVIGEIILKNKFSENIINVASGKSHTLENIITFLKKYGEIKYSSTFSEGSFDSEADISKLKKEFDLDPLCIKKLLELRFKEDF